jgi:hypothetical protein
MAKDWRRDFRLSMDIQDSATTITIRASHPFTPLCRHEVPFFSFFLSLQGQLDEFQLKFPFLVEVGLRAQNTI